MPPKFPLNSNSRSNDSHPLTAKSPAKFCSLFLWPSSNTRRRRPIDFHIATHTSIHAQNVFWRCCHRTRSSHRASLLGGG